MQAIDYVYVCICLNKLLTFLAASIETMTATTSSMTTVELFNYGIVVVSHQKVKNFDHFRLMRHSNMCLCYRLIMVNGTHSKQDQL